MLVLSQYALSQSRNEFRICLITIILYLIRLSNLPIAITTCDSKLL